MATQEQIDNAIEMTQLVPNTDWPNPVTNPPHYTWKGWIEPIDFIMSNNLWFAEANIIKYTFRYKEKNWLEDLKKARFYLDKLIKWEQ